MGIFVKFGTVLFALRAGVRRSRYFFKQFFSQTEADCEQINGRKDPTKRISKAAADDAKTGDKIKGANQIAQKLENACEQRKLCFARTLKKDADHKNNGHKDQTEAVNAPIIRAVCHDSGIFKQTAVIPFAQQRKHEKADHAVTGTTQRSQFQKDQL